MNAAPEVVTPEGRLVGGASVKWLPSREAYATSVQFPRFRLTSLQSLFHLLLLLLLLSSASSFWLFIGRLLLHAALHAQQQHRLDSEENKNEEEKNR